MASERIEVEPAVLTWARTSLRLSEELAARKLGVSHATLQRWESGAQPPTLNQLRKAASVYKRPLAVLLLSEPPMDFSVPRDFREGPSDPSPELVVEVRRAEEQRALLLELRQRQPDLIIEPTSLPNARVDEDPDEVGSRLRVFLGVSLENQQSWAQPRDALNGWASAFEARGVFVIQTSGVDIAEMLGFSVHGDGYPVIALNGSDWPRRKVFTLFHELAHLALGSGGICDLHDRPTSRLDTEAFCNRVAAAALMPASSIDAVVARHHLPSTGSWQLDDLQVVTDSFRVSQEATLVRLIGRQLASWDDYARLRPELHERYRSAYEAERRRMRESEGGPSYYVIKARNLGRAYTTAVLDAYHADALSSLDVANALGIRFKQLPRLEAAA